MSKNVYSHTVHITIRLKIWKLLECPRTAEGIDFCVPFRWVNLPH